MSPVNVLMLVTTTPPYMEVWSAHLCNFCFCDIGISKKYNYAYARVEKYRGYQINEEGCGKLIVSVKIQSKSVWSNICFRFHGKKNIE